MGKKYDYAFLGQSGRMMYYYDYRESSIDKMDETSPLRTEGKWINKYPYQIRVINSSLGAEAQRKVLQRNLQLRDLWQRGIHCGHGAGVVIGRVRGGRYLIVFNDSGNTGIGYFDGMNIAKFGITLTNAVVYPDIDGETRIQINNGEEIPVVRKKKKSKEWLW